MRAILTFMAMAMLIVSVGCDKGETKTEPAKATGAEGGGAAEVAAPSTGDTPAAKPADTEDKPAATDGAANDDASATQTVSLKLPGMTWGGCAASVKGALAGVSGVSDINCDTSSRSCTFSAPKDLDVAATLNKLVDDGNKHIKDWSNAE